MSDPLPPVPDPPEPPRALTLRLPAEAVLDSEPAPPNPAPEPQDTSHWASLSLDFVKFLISGLGFGVVLLGYSYSHTFFRSFGVSLYQLKMSTIDITYRGIALIEIPSVFGIFTGVILGSALLLALRSHLKPWLGMGVVALGVLLLTSGTLSLGRYWGEAHAQQIWAGPQGKRVLCRLKDDGKDPRWTSISKKIETLSAQERLKLIYRDKDTIYLAPQLIEIPEGRIVGESYVFETSDILYCRVIGT